jgi:NADH-quinone oxidoreductase subunit L
LGAYVASIFHLMTHAFFKALLFLAAGSVIHGMEHYAHSNDAHGSHSDPQDMRNMGGLRKKMPITFWTFVVGGLSLAGLPPFSGFWSKDEILLAALTSNPFVFVLLALTAVFTAFYTGRQLIMVFFGEPRTRDAAQAQESGGVMTLPLIVLAVLALFGGLINFPGSLWLEHWLEPSVGKHEAPPFNVTVALIFTLLSFLAIGLAVYLYRNGKRDASFAPLTSPLSRFLNQGWFVDAIYAKIVILFYMLSSFLARVFDLGGIDGVVNGIGTVTKGVAAALRPLQTGFVRNYGLVMLMGVVALLAWLTLVR